MLSYRLWRAFHHPPRHHPLFQYTLAHAKREQPRLTSAFFLWTVLCSGITFCWTALFDWLPVMLVILLLSLNTIYGSLWSVRVSAEIEARRDDLLAALPTGRIGSLYAISSGCLHRHSSFRWVPFIVQGIAIAALITTLSAVLLSLVALRNPYSSEVVAANIMILDLSIAGVFLAPLFYFDHLYTTLLAALVGMIAPEDALSRTEARLRAALALLTLQSVTYASIVAGITLGIMPLARSIAPSSTTAVILSGLLSALWYVIVREWSVRRVWRYFQQQANVHPNELSIILNAARR